MEFLPGDICGRVPTSSQWPVTPVISRSSTSRSWILSSLSKLLQVPGPLILVTPQLHTHMAPVGNDDELLNRPELFSDKCQRSDIFRD
jgi:hypothetical protein